jgi:hypothetical protein
MPAETEIYIRVIGAQGETWRSARAVHRSDDVYEITENVPNAGKQTGRLSSGDLVRCKPHELTDGDLVLVAFEKKDSGSS